MAAIDDLRAKLERAHEHFETFGDEMRRFFDAHKDATVIKLEVNTVERVIRMLIDMPEPPIRLSVILGDCAYNLRSSLDHIICYMAIANNKDCASTEFPIFLERNKYWEASKKGRPTRRSGLFKVANLCSQAQAVVELLQPYHGTNAHRLHPLWILQQICNEDKHRKLHLVVVAPESASLKLVMGSKIACHIKVTGPIHNGAIIARLDDIVPAMGITVEHIAEIARMGQNPMQMDGEFGMKVAFDEAGPGVGMLVDSTLKAINDHIALEVFPRLIPFLPR